MAANPRLYCAWFCPFAQRAWIGLLHKGVDFEYVEQDPYNKTPEWLAVNPRGLVPAIIHKGKAIYESTVLLEYIDEAWPQGKHILPQDPYDRAVARIWSDHVTKKIIPPFYAMLVKKGNEERENSKKEFLNQLLIFTDAMDKEGPYFMGNEFGLVDIMVIPWLLRLPVLKLYRALELPTTPEFQKLRKYIDSMTSLECVKKTIQNEEELIKSYQRYADDSVVSEVATAIREGKVLP